MKLLTGFAVALALMPLPAIANDTTAQLGTGGLVFVTNEDIEMASEDLSISTEQVKVVYKFHNKSREDQHILVAFPMPDIKGDGDFMVGIPTEDPENIFGFATTFNGKPVDAKLYQYAFANNIDYSEELKAMGVPLAPYGQQTLDALNALSDADKAKLYEQGLAIPMEYDAGNGQQVDTTPVWTLRSTYSWEATFPAGKDADVVHTYKPSVGGTVATTFIAPSADYDQSYFDDQFTAYKKKYCVDDDLVATLKKSAVVSDGYSNIPYTESWLSYIWSTGNNWSGPIGKFSLTVDKGDEANLVSFCGDRVKKIGPTTFQMTATDWFPPYEQELEILLLVRNDSMYQ
jgi:hypothetical protein